MEGKVEAVGSFDSTLTMYCQMILLPYRAELFLRLLGMLCNVHHVVYRVLHGNFLIEK